MGKFYAFAFGIFILLAALVADFYSMTLRSATGGLSVSGYVDRRVSMVRGLWAEAPQDLAAMLPEAPQGWTMAELSAADYADLIEGNDTAIVKTDAMLQEAQGLLVGYNLSGHQIVRRTYRKGDEAVLISAQLVPAKYFLGASGAQLAAMFDRLQTIGAPHDFARVRGLEFREKTALSTGAIRHVSGGILPQLQIEIVTNATDQRVLEVLRGLDVAGLNGLVDDPIDGLGESDLVELISTTGLPSTGDGQPLPLDDNLPGNSTQRCETRGAGKFCSLNPTQ